jgi:hypothetical protein
MSSTSSRLTKSRPAVGLVTVVGVGVVVVAVVVVVTAAVVLGV